MNKLHDIFKEKSSYSFHALSYKKQVRKDIQKCRQKNADYIIMCMHSGGQYNNTPDPYTLSLVKWLSKQDIDFIIGNHPHVVHLGKKTGKKRFVAYSLGNLCSYPGSETAHHENDSEVLADYSIILHLNFYEKSDTVEVSFEICKSIVEEDRIARIYSLYDLICKEEDLILRGKLLNDNERIVRKFIDNQEDTITLQKEYNFN